jgi:hypothetical protein
MRVTFQPLVATASIVVAACGADQNDNLALQSIAVTAFADRATCQVRDKVLPCAQVGNHLVQELRADSDTLILVSNASDSSSNIAADISRKLRQEGFANVGVAGFVSELPNSSR